MLSRIGVERLLNLFTAPAVAALQRPQSLIAEVGRPNHRPELLFEVALAIDVFGKDQQPAIVSSSFLRRRLDATDVGETGTHVRPYPIDQITNARIGRSTRLLSDPGHLVEQRLLLRGQPGGSLGCGSRRLDLRLLLGTYFLFSQFGAVVISCGWAFDAAVAFLACRASVRRWTRSVRANASIEDSKRFWRYEITRAEAC
jgi:hypothetical protein